MFGAYIIGIIIAVIGMAVSWQLKSKFKKYSKMQLSNGMSGKEVAEKMLNDNGIFDVKVISVSGQLTDHYNPANKTVNLSDSVYSERNAAAAAVAAHEVGHAVQHAKGYAWLQLRSKLVPIVNVSSTVLPWVLIGGILMVNTFPQLLLLGIILFAATTVFSFITLPVEFDASNRALAWIKQRGVVNSTEYEGSKDALKWAALTYVVAALGSLATLLYYVSIYMGRRD
jgi:Zn-dependent membrane protease YugP